MNNLYFFILCIFLFLSKFNNQSQLISLTISLPLFIEYVSPSVILTCTPNEEIFCLSRLTTCTCTVNGPVLQWTVYNATSINGHITHIKGQLNYNYSVLYPLDSNGNFISSIMMSSFDDRNEVRAQLVFTPTNEMGDYIIECWYNESMRSLRPIKLNGKK